MLTLLHLVGAVASMASLMGFVYMIAALVAVARFARSGWTPPATRPAVTILKPVCGLDPGLYENLLSYCRQEYGAPVQVVIGAHRESDPAVAVARAVMAAVPEADVALVIDGALPGTNFKICNLSNMMAAAKHDVLVIADSDMRVGPDYLDSVVSKLSEPGVGIATTLYTARPIGGGLASRLGCGFINYGFLPSVLVGQLIHAAPFCSGATIALTRQTLERIGGFEALVNQLADDYAIGAAVRSLGLKVAIARYVPENLVTEANFRALFQHELRWQRTIRSITPLGLAASVITNPAALALVALPLSGFAGYAWLLLAATLAARLGVVYMCDRFFGLVPTGLSLVVPRELLSQIVLAASFCGQRVTWRNSNFQVGSGGKLTLEGDPLA